MDSNTTTELKRQEQQSTPEDEEQQLVELVQDTELLRVQGQDNDNRGDDWKQPVLNSIPTFPNPIPTISTVCQAVCSNLKVSSSENCSSASSPPVVEGYKRRPKRPESVLRDAATMVANGSTFLEASEKYDIPISTIRFYMVRKGMSVYKGDIPLDEIE